MYYILTLLTLPTTNIYIVIHVPTYKVHAHFFVLIEN